MKKFYILTLGCQMNKSDSERLAGFLISHGLKQTLRAEEADVLIANACSVRQTAIDRIYGTIRNWNKWQTRKPGILTVLTGCILKQDVEKLEERFDLVLGIGEWERIVKKTKKQKNKKTHEGEYFEVLPKHANNFSAFVPIMTGCNNFCAYCVVPYARGRERSRSVKEVIKEIKDLAKNGYLEITLLGQNVNSYNPKDKKSFSRKNPYRHPFAALLWEVNNISGIKRIFFTASHPKDMADEVIDALNLSNMVNYLHLPLQSGDDAILKKMNRKYTGRDYLKLIKKIKKKRPGMALGTDIIIGFPGETKKQFQNTLKLYRAADFDISYHSKYSSRPGTAAARLKDDVLLTEKKRRWFEIQRLMEKITLKKNKKFEGKIVSVLVDKYKNGKCEGNSSEMKRVEFLSNENLIGKIVDVKIDQALTWILRGRSNPGSV